MGKLHTIFWDVDGTLADTEIDGHRVAFNKAFSKFNLNWFWNETEYKSLLRIHGGGNRINYYAKITKSYLSKSDLLEITSLKKEYYLEILKEGLIKPRIGVRRLLSELANKNISQFIVTTSSLTSVKALLKYVLFDYMEVFESIVSSDHVVKTKPDPECYIMATNISNSDRKNILVIEDSYTGLQSATSAGLKTLITLSPWLQESEANFVDSVCLSNHLGDRNNPCTIHTKHKDKISQINYSFLESLL